MLYTTHWNVNDGRNGYPNIQAELTHTDIFCNSYVEAIQLHAKFRGVNRVLNIAEMVGRGCKGKINGRNYRDYHVTYLANDVTRVTEVYSAGEVVAKTVRVFGGYSKKSGSL